jgi:hypothetical protein
MRALQIVFGVKMKLSIQWRDEFPAQKIAGLKIICVMTGALKQLNNYVQNFSHSLAAHTKPYFSAAQVSLPATMH